VVDVRRGIFVTYLVVVLGLLSCFILIGLLGL
jgi:hypothetical protein